MSLWSLHVLPLSASISSCDGLETGPGPDDTELRQLVKRENVTDMFIYQVLNAEARFNDERDRLKINHWTMKP